MTNNSKPSNSTIKQIQNAFRFSLVTAVFMSALSVVSLVIGELPTSALHITTLLIVVAVASVISTVLSRRGMHILGIMLVIASLFFACIATAIQFSGFGAVLAIVALIISFGAGSVALPRNYQYLSNTVSSLLALGFILLDVFEPFPRLPNNDPTLTWIIAGILIVLFGLGILRNFGEYNFRTKLIISFIFTSVVTVGILTVFNQNATNDILTTNLGRELENQTEIRARRLGDLLSEQIINLRILADNELIETSASARNEAYSGDEQAILAEIEQLDQRWRAADAADDNNDPLVKETLTHESSGELKEYQEISPSNLEVFFTDRYGALLGATNRTSDYYQADEEWWQAAYNDGEGAIYISDPEFDESAGEFSILIAIPILEMEGAKISGILRTTYQLSTLDIILGEPIGETGEADLYIPGDPPYYVHEGGYEPVETNLYNRLQQTVDQIYAEMDYQGTDSVVSQAPVMATDGNPAIENLGWFIAVHQDTAEVFGPVQSQTRNSLGLVIVIVGVAAALAILLSQVLVNPISRLTTTAQEIAAGALDLQAEVTTGDEVGLLATTFNEMTAQLRNILANLEDRVAARTRDLELAAEIGRRLSLVSETEAMLTEAVNIIQERFDLYYTQVYLADPTGRSLVLQAGTGEVGQTLLRRGHRLPLDMGSLNGIAATERRTVLVEDTTTSTLHRPNPLLPKTRSELAIPLVVSERVVGVLDMQSSQPGALNAENRTAFEALAGSLAIAIANTELFEQAEEARVTVETQSRRLTRTGWQDFLDAIQRSERVAFSYDRETVSPLPELIPNQVDETTLATPIQVSGASVGRLLLKRDEAWTEDDHAIINVVSSQVAQQIENLRLLAQAEQYRAEAQEALQRLTREGWDQYQEQLKDQQIGFLYSDYEVKPLVETGVAADKLLAYPITVRDEPIGQLEILDAEGLSEEDEELVTYVKEQLGAHLENLRLSQRTELALAETEDQSKRLAALNELSEQLTNAQNLEQIFDMTSYFIDRIIPTDLASITWPAEDGESLEVYALQGASGASTTGTTLPFEGTVVGTVFQERRVINIPDLSKSDYPDDAQLTKQGIRSSMSVPLLTTDRTLGTLNFGSQRLNAFDNRTRDLAIQAASLISNIIENRNLFQQAQSRAQHEQALREIATQVYAAPDAESILQKAAEEISRKLGLEAFVYLEKPDEPLAASPETIASEEV